MINFFRHIRQKLLSENRFSKYLLYAIGEIILVVIGILIALQINNWNDLRKEKTIERKYLEALKDEYESNLQVLTSTIEENQNLVKQLTELLSFFDGAKLEKTPSKAIAKTIGNTLRYEVIFAPSTGVQTDIISSGNLSQLKNQELRQKIASLGNALQVVSRHEMDAIEVKDELVNSITEKISLRVLFEAVGNEVPGHSEFKTSDLKLLFRSMKMENDLILYQGIAKTTGVVFYNPLKEDIETILQTIENELNK